MLRITTLLALLSPAGLFAQCVTGPMSAAGNFAVVLEGREFPGDSATPAIWGLRDYHVFPLQFFPPDGWRVRILSISGDLIATPTFRGEKPAVVEEGRFAGVLAAVGINESSQGSQYGDWMADDVLVYAQGTLGKYNPAITVQFREHHGATRNNVLHPSNKLYFTVAKYQDDTGTFTNLEITFSSVVYEFFNPACD